MTPDQRESLRQKVLAEFSRRIPRVAKNHHAWEGWPGTWVFADAAVSVLVEALAPAANPGAVSEDVQRFAIEVEKLLCSKLGREWRPSGMSIESLVDDIAAPAAPSELVATDWRHIANEWADMAANGTQWLRNIRDGISTTAEALECMETNDARIQALSRPATPPPSAKPTGAGEVVAWLQSLAFKGECVPAARRLCMTDAWKRHLISEGHTDVTDSYDVPLYTTPAATAGLTDAEDVQRARLIAEAAQRFADDRTHLGGRVYVNDLAWALRVLASGQPSAEQGVAPEAEPFVFDSRFLSDVMTAAGLVEHGKQCKALSARIAEAVAAIRSRTTPPAAQGAPVMAEAVADAICLAVAELPDRNSPEDWPEAMLVTADELHAIVVETIRTTPSLAAQGAPVMAEAVADAQIDNVLNDLNKHACQFDADEYGLPVGHPHELARMREIVRRHIAAATLKEQA